MNMAMVIMLPTYPIDHILMCHTMESTMEKKKNKMMPIVVMHPTMMMMEHDDVDICMQ